MIGSAPTRLRALVLLVALSLSLAGQALASTLSIATAPSPVEQVSAAGVCPDCGDGGAAMALPCFAVSCWNLAAIATGGFLIDGAEPGRFAAPTGNVATGRSPRPDPYPPRALRLT